MQLTDAQQAVRTDWVAVYNKIAKRLRWPRSSGTSVDRRRTDANQYDLGHLDTCDDATAVGSGHTFYASSASNAVDIYCDADSGWQSLSKANLRSFPSLDDALATYPSRHLRKPCSVLEKAPRQERQDSPPLEFLRFSIQLAGYQR